MRHKAIPKPYALARDNANMAMLPDGTPSLANMNPWQRVAARDREPQHRQGIRRIEVDPLSFSAARP